MAQLTTDTPRSFLTDFINDLGVKAAAKIYDGSAVGVDSASGYVRQLVANDLFVGFCTTQVDNTNGANGDKNCRVRREGRTQLAVAGAVITDIGRPVYMSDGATFTFDGSNSATFLGYVVQFVSAGVVVVEYDVFLGETQHILAIPVDLASIAAADYITQINPGFAGRIKAMQFNVTKAATTAAKLATLTPKVSATLVTGGAVALTSANCTPVGAKVAGSAITAGATFKASDTLSIVGSAVTAFVEGSGVLTLTLGE